MSENTNITIKEMNNNLYAAAFHLLEAGKYLSNVDEWRPAAGDLFERANFLISIIKEEPEKVSTERVDEILNEILNFKTGETK
jgi:hypothetical protein